LHADERARSGSPDGLKADTRLTVSDLNLNWLTRHELACGRCEFPYHP
jgi:hypothetical protein